MNITMILELIALGVFLVRLMGLMAAGYAGTDFIEGVMKKAKV